mmetsp:Transcript_3926/g.10883  ORF Transcript_3926/g.10883 Transcript_3926/m.10883 type:complete len:208 (+) Transcript_3926:540-1163(+)
MRASRKLRLSYLTRDHHERNPGNLAKGPCRSWSEARTHTKLDRQRFDSSSVARVVAGEMQNLRPRLAMRSDQQRVQIHILSLLRSEQNVASPKDKASQILHAPRWHDVSQNQKRQNVAIFRLVAEKEMATAWAHHVLFLRSPHFPRPCVRKATTAQTRLNQSSSRNVHLCVSHTDLQPTGARQRRFQHPRLASQSYLRLAARYCLHP